MNHITLLPFTIDYNSHTSECHTFTKTNSVVQTNRNADGNDFMTAIRTSSNLITNANISQFMFVVLWSKYKSSISGTSTDQLKKAKKCPHLLLLYS